MTAETTVEVGTVVPPWEMPDVDPARMKTMAAILRDPYPVHWDPDSVAALGRGHRVINQGPLNLAYITNMLMAWQGDGCIRRLQVSFTDPVLDHESVTAMGTVTSIDEHQGEHGAERRATCEIRLDRGGETVVIGVAVVALRDGTHRTS